MMNFVKFAHNRMFTPEKEKIEFSKSEPYLFCTDWRDQIKVKVLNTESLNAYEILGGKPESLRITHDAFSEWGSGVITRCGRKVNLGYYNLSTKDMMLKNTIQGAHVVIPYFDGATEEDIKRLLLVYPVVVYYNTSRSTKLVYCFVEDLNQVVYELITEKGWLSAKPSYKAWNRSYPKFAAKGWPAKIREYITNQQVTVFDLFNSRHSMAVDLLEYNWFFSA